MNSLDGTSDSALVYYLTGFVASSPVTTTPQYLSTSQWHNDYFTKDIKIANI